MPVQRFRRAKDKSPEWVTYHPRSNQVEAKLTTALDTVLRYQAAIKRDLYRALAALRDMRRDREGEV